MLISIFNAIDDVIKIRYGVVNEVTAGKLLKTAKCAEIGKLRGIDLVCSFTNTYIKN